MFVLRQNTTGATHKVTCNEMNRLPLRYVLCPIDLSSLSMNSLEWANAIARARSAELRALHVVVTEGLAGLEPSGSRDRGDLMMKLREALIATDSENVHTGAAIKRGDPGTQILKFARSLPADVIVMAAAGAERPTRPMGSVTATLVARSDCPLLIVPAGRRFDPLTGGAFTRILCAVDLAPSSMGVIRQALSLAWETHGHLTFVCVMTGPGPSPSEIRAQLLASIPPHAHSWCDIELVVTPGEPATEIVRVAETANADILLIGPPRQWTSTTEAVLAKSLCPVLVAHDARPLAYPRDRPATAGNAPG
jgi:nucleotide-binding universal stress UspA family protein